MVVKAVDPNKDVRHVKLKMTAEEVQAYSTYGLELQGKPCRIPKGIDVIFYGVTPNTETVTATFFVSPINVDPLSRKTGKDIDDELARLPVIQDNVNPNQRLMGGTKMVSHPYFKIETDLSNPELDYNNGELDFLRSKPVNVRTAWRPSHEIDLINSQFRIEQNIINETEDGKKPIKQIVKDESKAKIHPETGEKWYPYQIGQITEGGDKERDGAKPDEGVGGLNVGPHWQQVSDGTITTRRWYQDSMHIGEAKLMGKAVREELKAQADESEDFFKK